MRIRIGLLVIIFVLTGIIFLSPFNVKADDLDNQIALKETQLQSLQWEFRYLQERMGTKEKPGTIQYEAQKLQAEIDVLKKQKEEKLRDKNNRIGG